MKKCKSCKAEIVWVRTRAGKAMPCDPILHDYEDGAIVTENGDVRSDGGLGYRPHWASCPSADAHRNQGKLF